MPYKSGDYPDEDYFIPVSTLEELIAVAQSHMGTAPTPIRLMDSTLAPDDMNQALQQAGGGYVLCALNTDGTQITYSPAMGMTMEECMSLLAEADRLADLIISQTLTDHMAEREKAQALFSYVTENVTYDQRYYADEEAMPYASRTAVGALRDHLAICGGYANAVKLLFEKAGIRCYNVSGSYFRENHMWIIAFIDGEQLWFDATAGRGSSVRFGLSHFAMKDLDASQYQWNEERIAPLLKTEV